MLKNHITKSFKKHIENLRWNANYKLHALRRMRKLLAAEKAKLLGNAFIDCMFLSCHVRVSE